METLTEVLENHISRVDSTVHKGYLQESLEKLLEAIYTYAYTQGAMETVTKKITDGSNIDSWHKNKSMFIEK